MEIHPDWNPYPFPFELFYLKRHIAGDLFTFLIVLGVFILLFVKEDEKKIITILENIVKNIEKLNNNTIYASSSRVISEGFFNFYIKLVLQAICSKQISAKDGAREIVKLARFISKIKKETLGESPSLLIIEKNK